jgi:hypothetical protein
MASQLHRNTQVETSYCSDAIELSWFSKLALSGQFHWVDSMFILLIFLLLVSQDITVHGGTQEVISESTAMW